MGTARAETTERLSRELLYRALWDWNGLSFSVMIQAGDDYIFSCC